MDFKVLRMRELFVKLFGWEGGVIIGEKLCNFFIGEFFVFFVMGEGFFVFFWLDKERFYL